MNASGTVSTGTQPVAGPVTTTALTIGAVIAMAETDRLIESAITSDGASRSLADVVGPAALGSYQREAWTVWGKLPEPELVTLVANSVWIHVLLDLLFVAGYTLLLRRILGSAAPVARRILRFLVSLEVIEALLLLASAVQLRAAHAVDGLAWTVAVVATVKWVAVAGLLIAALRSRVLRQRIGEALRRTRHAIWVQRLSLVVVAFISTLSLVPLPGIWDQLPDAQRGWGSAAASALPAGEPSHPVSWAFVSMTAVAIALFFLGRRRAERAWATHVTLQVPTERAVYWWWLVGPITAAIVTVTLRLRDRDDLVDGRTVAIFIIVPVTLVACSWVLRQRGESWTGRQRRVARATSIVAVLAFGVAIANLLVERDWAALIIVLIAMTLALALSKLVVWWRRERPLWAQQPEETDRRRALDVVRAGDVLALAVVVVAGLGLVRSFTAPYLLQQSVVPDDTEQVALLGVGILLILLAPLGGERLVARLDAGPVPAGSGVVASVRRSLRPSYPGWLPIQGGSVSCELLTLVVCGAAILVLGSLAAHPTGLTAELGVVATAEAALGAWAVVLGFLIVHLQHRRPLEVFRLIHLRANPVITLLAGSMLTVSLAGGDPELHVVRAVGSAVPADRPDLGEAFHAWVARSGACDRPVRTPDGATVHVRPMVLIAASGGGIRATVWTAGALERLSRAGSCGPTAVMLSSGVSGGSLGLVLTRATGASERAERLAGPEALGVAVAGTLVGDQVAALTGLRWPAHGERQWRDRAALMETVWEGQDPLLATAYNAEVVSPAGALVLNSAAAGLHCRVLISQIDLGGSDRGPAETAAPTDCRAHTGLPAASLDLHTISCSPSMSWATAAMLSARFPTITPAGRLSRCDGEKKDLQLIDGGYAEGSGVGTLAELAPRLAQEVREHNANGGVFVVPIVVYLEDETRAELEVRAPDLAPELFVPISGLGAASRMTASGTWIQRAADAFADPCPRTGQPACTAAVADVRKRLPGGVVVVAPVTRPAINAPLGWTLSRYSLDRLNKDLDDQLNHQPTGCRRIQHYGCLKDLAAFLTEGRGD